MQVTRHIIPGSRAGSTICLHQLNVTGRPESEVSNVQKHDKQAVLEAVTICPRPLQVDLLTLKVVSESLVTWVTSVPILVFLGLSVLDLGSMYTTDTSEVRCASSLNANDGLCHTSLLHNSWSPSC